MTYRAAWVFVLWFLFVAAGVLFTVYEQHRLDDERSNRNQQVNQAFLLNCMNREREIGELRRKLGLPPTGVQCKALPVFEQGGN